MLYMLTKETSGHLGPNSDFVSELINNSEGQVDIPAAEHGCRPLALQCTYGG